MFTFLCGILLFALLLGLYFFMSWCVMPLQGVSSDLRVLLWAQAAEPVCHYDVLWLAKLEKELVLRRYGIRVL